jgi:hypothetical protein
MDESLAERLNHLDEQKELLRQAEFEFRLKKADQESFENEMISQAAGESQAARKMNAARTKEWRAFQRELAVLETAFNHEKRKYDILTMAYYAEKDSMKIDSDMIKRQVG